MNTPSTVGEVRTSGQADDHSPEMIEANAEFEQDLVHHLTWLRARFPGRADLTTAQNLISQLNLYITAYAK